MLSYSETVVKLDRVGSCRLESVTACQGGDLQLGFGGFVQLRLMLKLLLQALVLGMVLLQLLVVASILQYTNMDWDKSHC